MRQSRTWRAWLAVWLLTLGCAAPEALRAREGGEAEVSSRPLGVAPVTRFGIDPFDPDEQGEYRCPLGHTAGLSILSELSVKREDWDGSDLCAAEQWMGYRSRNGGVFRPYPLLLVSQQLRRVLGELKARGFELEVAHLL
ncbi:MAG TPA: hypothetical protein VEU33_22810 [Archangium sp.]|nr:hypothetical protein [Archangium sp.]